ncbi:unnamed protein product [Protopolystoma xenopodis]|uniref:Uncharacterized protein n=1 Tax=Protopolystoma xenopodis TaxID=117903 RepID=A0A448WLF8_9PLAT|nr:unnamed protein product [Protopolystoma xenopodis]
MTPEGSADAGRSTNRNRWLNLRRAEQSRARQTGNYVNRRSFTISTARCSHTLKLQTHRSLRQVCERCDNIDNYVRADHYHSETMAYQFSKEHVCNGLGKRSTLKAVDTLTLLLYCLSSDVFYFFSGQLSYG